MTSRNPDTGQWTDADVEYPPEPTRMLVFDGALTSEQAEKIKLVYRYLWDLPAPVRRAIVTDLTRHSDGEACGNDS